MKAINYFFSKFIILPAVYGILPT